MPGFADTQGQAMDQHLSTNISFLPAEGSVPEPAQPAFTQG